MNALVVTLLAVNLLLLAAVLIVVLLRGKSSNAVGSAAATLGPELRQEFALLRSEISQSIAAGQQQFDARLLSVSQVQTSELARDRESRQGAALEQRDLLERSLAGLNDRMHTMSQAGVQTQIEFTQAVEAKFEELRRTLGVELEKMRHGNEAKLEKMRETVDEKLQGTLEKRLGESFSLVSERLEQVQKGLGEMQTLASDVGGLKRVLTNVKSRGSWGEVQLARQLEDMLTPEQYQENVAVRPDSAERVEFAIKLPGRDNNDVPVWLPIDSKFPQEDYERLLEAQETGDTEAIQLAGRTIEKVILTQAKLIHDKYVHPPHSTDFAIMYLPTEGLFAEAIRRPGLANKIQREFRVTIAGPTVLMSLLNSLQLGFRTLAIEQRSSEVWKVLGAAKAEFQKYGQVWDKLEKQLATAQNTVQQAGVRTRAVERTLRDVETYEASKFEEIEAL